MKFQLQLRFWSWIVDGLQFVAFRAMLKGIWYMTTNKSNPYRFGRVRPVSAKNTLCFACDGSYCGIRVKRRLGFVLIMVIDIPVAAVLQVTALLRILAIYHETKDLTTT